MQSMTWGEIKATYPNQWVSLGDVEQEDNGEIKAGVVIAVGPDIKTVAEQSKDMNFKSHQFEYTGEPNYDETSYSRYSRRFAMYNDQT